MDKKSQILMSVLGVFALVIVTVGVSYAFFNYSRTGETSNTIQSGEVSFTYEEGESVTLENAFPVADSIGAADPNADYTFTVSTTIVGNASMAYDVILVKDMNKVVCTATDTPAGCTAGFKGYFTDDQIKFNLFDGTSYVKGTAATGELMNSLTWTNGEAKVVTNAAITSGTPVNYVLRMWIDQGVDYSNTVSGQDEQTSVGKYNGFEYSLKVKVEARATNNYTGA